MASPDPKDRRTGWARLCLSGGLGLLLIGAGACVDLQAQVPVTGRGKDFVAPVTDAQGRRTVIRGENAKPAGRGMVEIGGMQAQTYRGQQKDMLVQAPQCLFDTQSNVASSSGPISIRRADESFSIEGTDYRWQMGDSRVTSKLVISNGVQSVVRKPLLQTAAPGPSASSSPSVAARASATPPATPPLATAPSPEDSVQITAREFEYQSDVAIFRGNVRVHEAEGILTCERLTVRFREERGALTLERIEAENEVVLEQAGTRALSEKAIYTAGPGQDELEFLGRAVWEDSERAGSGERILFDRIRRTVRAEGRAYLRVPRTVLGETGLLSGAPGGGSAVSKRASGSHVEIFADELWVQLPPDRGPVQRIIAERNVLIVDSEQDGRALADRASYDEAIGILQLTGSPMMETERRLITGGVLNFDRATRVFSAGPDAYVKLPFQTVLSMGMLSSAASSTENAPAQTNQFIEIWAREFEYRTNALQFRGAVRVNFLDSDVPLGKVTCELLTIRYGQEVESMVAENNVEMEQYALGGDQRIARKVACERFTATFDADGRLQLARAEQGVSAEQEEARTDQRPLITRLSSDSVTAFFSPVTNQLQRIEADLDVTFAQEERVAKGARAVYTQASGLLELSGQPTARMPEGRVLQADRLIWDSVNSRFIGQGKFKSEWKRPPGSDRAAAAPREE